jgi:hypothetical protein
VDVDDEENEKVDAVGLKHPASVSVQVVHSYGVRLHVTAHPSKSQSGATKARAPDRLAPRRHVPAPEHSHAAPAGASSGLAEVRIVPLAPADRNGAPSMLMEDDGCGEAPTRTPRHAAFSPGTGSNGAAAGTPIAHGAGMVGSATGRMSCLDSGSPACALENAHSTGALSQRGVVWKPGKGPHALDRHSSDRPAGMHANRAAPGSGSGARRTDAA